MANIYVDNRWSRENFAGVGSSNQAIVNIFPPNHLIFVLFKIVNSGNYIPITKNYAISSK